MNAKFKFSALTLALLVAFTPTISAAKSKTKQVKAAAPAATSTTSKLENLFTRNYPMTFAGTVPTSNAWKWSPTAPVMPTNYDQFMVWAEDINGGKSNEPLFNCWDDTICVGGLLDMDLMYYNRNASATSIAGIGVRPQFSQSVTEPVGNLNNANLLFDLKFANLVRVHANIDYVNSSTKVDTYAWAVNGDTHSVYTSSASVKADELYAVFSNQYTYPVYAKVGRFYLDFGQYSPNGYGLPTITPSLTQLMTQIRTGGAQIGLAMQNGIYGSATWSMAQQSLMSLAGRLGRKTADRNYSARLGFMRQFENAYVNVNASYVFDIRDSDYLSGNLYVLNTYFVPSLGGSDFGPFQMRRQHAYAVHADGKFMQWGGGIEGAATTGGLNPRGNSNLWTAGANINYSFPIVNHDASLDLSYQIARHAAFIYGTGVTSTPPLVGVPIGPLSNQFPKNRMQLSFIAKIVKHVNLGFQWVHDKDFAPSAGTNLTSDMGIFRIDLEV